MTDQLPPEMQERIQQIIAGAQQQSEPLSAPPPPPPPAAPNLMDLAILTHRNVEALRQQVAQLQEQQMAIAQVVDATGQAVGTLYEAHRQQTMQTTNRTASQRFQQEEPDDY